MDPTQYTLTFRNQTDSVWTMAVFATLANSSFQTVAWLLCRAPHSGFGRVRFTTDDAVAIAELIDDVFFATQILPAESGSSWDVIFEDGVKQLVPGSGTASPGRILITNRSGQRVNAGVGMSLSPMVYSKDLLSGASAIFTVPMTLSVSIFKTLELGEIISVAQMAVPQQPLNFPSGITNGIATATLDGTTLQLTIDYPSLLLEEEERERRRDDDFPPL
jgi:hypothetical protein